MAAVADVEGRFATVAWGGRSVRLLLAKNPAGWTELLDLLEGGTDPVVIGINARIADGHDPSWLWDVPFERLGGRLVVATGRAVSRPGGATAPRRRGPRRRCPTISTRCAPRASPTVQYVGNYTAFQALRRHLVHTARPSDAAPTPRRLPARRSAPRGCPWTSPRRADQAKDEAPPAVPDRRALGVAGGGRAP